MEILQSQVQQMGPMGPHGNGSTSGTVSALLLVIIILLLVIIVYLWYNNRRKDRQRAEEQAAEIEPIESDKIEVALRLLNDNEKIIVQALLDHGGEMLQKDISYELELTRVQTHRAVQSLMERGIVITEDHYNTKKVTLAQWLIQ
jgi:uncharacterized membrane protein